MQRNEFGQPVGRPVPGWTLRPRVAPTTLIGDHVRLEPLTREHAGLLYATMVTESAPDVWTYYPYPPAMSLRAFEQVVAQQMDTADGAAMAVVGPDGRALGFASYLRIDPANGSVEVGRIVYSTALQRTTAATETMILMARHVVDDLGYRRYEWKCDSCNEPSRAAAARLGFSYEGRFRNASVYKGRNRDTDWFAITREDWPAISAAYDAWLDPGNFDPSGNQRRSLSDLVAGRVGGSPGA